MPHRTTLLALAGCLLSLNAAVADNWPAWRGPTGQGHCTETNLPLTWSATENVKWKVPLGYQGNSTPIIFGDKIFLTEAHDEGKVRGIICLSRKAGDIVWRKDIEYPEKERSWNPAWYCNASPVTDGERVVVSFGSAGMYCYDLEGKELWKRTDLGRWDHAFGNSASPVIYGDTVILWCGPNEKEGRNFLLSVNKKTGETIWEHDEADGSWATPLITEVDGQDQLLLGMGPHLKGFNPQTGEEIWRCAGLQSYVYTSALYGNGVAVGMSGYNRSALAVKLGGKGDITADRLWHQPKATQRVGSGVIVGDHVYMVEENGVPHCYELTSGEEVWNVTKRPEGGTTWGSIVHADGRLYVLMRNGTTLVFDASPEYKVLATNSLGGGVNTNSSVAISDGDIFLRTFTHLWCIAEQE